MSFNTITVHAPKYYYVKRFNSMRHTEVYTNTHNFTWFMQRWRRCQQLCTTLPILHHLMEATAFTSSSFSHTSSSCFFHLLRASFFLPVLLSFADFWGFPWRAGLGSSCCFVSLGTSWSPFTWFMALSWRISMDFVSAGVHLENNFYFYSHPLLFFEYTCTIPYSEKHRWGFGLVNSVKIAKLKPCVPLVLRIQITKFKLHQYILRANSPNLMLTKLFRYTVLRAWTHYCTSV